MTIKEFLKWVIEHKEYAPLYSSLVATGALLFSILSFIISKNRAKKDKIISDARYDEQKKQYEERLQEERKRREEDKSEFEEKNRISEEPYLVLKKTQMVNTKSSKLMIVRMEFMNKGRGSAYEIHPERRLSVETRDGNELIMQRHGVVKDPIAMVGELFIVEWGYQGEEEIMFKTAPIIQYRDASGRRYKQTYKIDAMREDGTVDMISYSQPELCE